MDTVDTYREIVQRILAKYEHIRYAHGDFHNEAVFDTTNDRYVIMSVGWDKTKRVHGSLIHVDIIGDKVWIQRDGTEDGVALEFVEAGIPKSNIVLAFHPPDVWPDTGYAVM